MQASWQRRIALLILSPDIAVTRAFYAASSLVSGKPPCTLKEPSMTKTREDREQYLSSLLPSRKHTLAIEYRRALGIPIDQPLRPGMSASQMMMAILDREFPSDSNPDQNT